MPNSRRLRMCRQTSSWKFAPAACPLHRTLSYCVRGCRQPTSCSRPFYGPIKKLTQENTSEFGATYFDEKLCTIAPLPSLSANSSESLMNSLSKSRATLNVSPIIIVGSESADTGIHSGVSPKFGSPVRMNAARCFDIRSAIVAFLSLSWDGTVSVLCMTKEISELCHGVFPPSTGKSTSNM